MKEMVTISYTILISIGILHKDEQGGVDVKID